MSKTMEQIRHEEIERIGQAYSDFCAVNPSFSYRGLTGGKPVEVVNQGVRFEAREAGPEEVIRLMEAHPSSQMMDYLEDVVSGRSAVFIVNCADPGGQNLRYAAYYALKSEPLDYDPDARREAIRQARRRSFFSRSEYDEPLTPYGVDGDGIETGKDPEEFPAHVLGLDDIEMLDEAANRFGQPIDAETHLSHRIAIEEAVIPALMDKAGYDLVMEEERGAPVIRLDAGEALSVNPQAAAMDTHALFPYRLAAARREQAKRQEAPSLMPD